MPVKHGAQKRNLKWVTRRISFPILPEHVERLTTPISAHRFGKLVDHTEFKNVLATAYEAWRQQSPAKFLADYDNDSAWRDLAILLAVLTLPALKSVRPSFLRPGRDRANDLVVEQDARWLIKAVDARPSGQSIKARADSR
jgi:hypothetical protein